MGERRASQEETHAGAEVADLLGSVAKEHHRRRGLPALGHPTPPARVIRERAKDASVDAIKKGPGRPKRDPNVVEMEQELQRTNKALRELAIENTLLRGKPDGV